FLDFLELAQQHRTNALLFQIQRDAEHAVGKLEHLAGHRVLDTVDAGDAVPDGNDAANFGDIDVDGVAPDLLANNLGNLVSFDVHSQSSLTITFSDDSSRPELETQPRGSEPKTQNP